LVEDLVEFRVTVSETGVAQQHQSVNGAPEESATAGSATEFAGAFSDLRLYLNSRGTANRGFIALAAVKILRGVQTLAAMRAA
ncbi:MAG: hypothetical protein L0219_03540, partial [Phycisphaerales bacterium]|nr:hypothetical protein [Phycisphaerales bacterium]